MSRVVFLGGHPVGEGHRVFITAEIGINHNGNLELAKRLIDAASEAGCDAVKFQKRTPEKCVPRTQWEVLRETPWGAMPYIEYRRRIELSAEAYHEINSYCIERSVLWFASCWDEDSIAFIAQFDPPCYKVPSPMLTKDALLCVMRTKGRPIILSTGMSTLDQVEHAVTVLGLNDLVILQCTGAYPSENEELNLRVIQDYRRRFDCPVGFSGHTEEIETTPAAVALGACYVERHITLDRNMWGSDHAASVEPHDFKRLVCNIRAIEAALGDGEKRIYDSERPHMIRLRGTE